MKKKINLEKNKNVEKIRNTIRNKTINLNDHSKANNEEKLKSPKKWLMKKSIVPGFLRIQKRNAAKMLETYEKASPFKLNINEGESEIFSSFSSPNKKFHEK